MLENFLENVTKDVGRLFDGEPRWFHDGTFVAVVGCSEGTPWLAIWAIDKSPIHLRYVLQEIVTNTRNLPAVTQGTLKLHQGFGSCRLPSYWKEFENRDTALTIEPL